MWKIILYIATLILLSLFICVKKPEMHKQFVFTDSNIEFVDVDIPTNNTTPVTNVDIKNQNVNLDNHDLKFGGDIKNKNVPIKNVETRKNVNFKPQQVKLDNKPISKTETKPVTQPPKQEIQQPVSPKKEELKPVQKQEAKPKPILTEQEEIIAWNHWRSRLQNQVMMDSKISAPLGTQFKFTFTVDKYGNMSNIKVWSTNPAYSDLAVRVIKPVLMNYRNKPILNFPYGTQRIITNVEGGFVISRVSRYSSPSDYNDYEHVKR